MTMPLSMAPNGTSGEVVDLDSFRKKADNDQTLSFIKSEYDRAKNARQTLERQWYTNLSFFYGKQYVNVVNAPASAGGGFRLSTPKAPPWRVRLVTNKIRPIIRTELAKLTASKPSAMVLPASMDDRDVSAARAAELIWESLYSRKHYKAVLRDALWWTTVTGTGYIKTYWDDTLEDVGSKQMGDICYIAETPFHVFVPDLREREVENQPFMMHVQTRDPAWVSMRYKRGLDGKEVKPNTTATNDILEASFLNLVGSAATEKNSVLITETYIKPGQNKAFPDGATITMVADQLVQIIEGMPYPHGEFPFAKIDHIPSGKYYADSVVTDLISLQQEFNRTRSQIIEAKNMTTKPQLLAARGSMDPRKVTTEPGQVIFYCVDTATKAITRNGYKAYDDLNIGEDILSYNANTDTCEWQTTTGKFVSNDAYQELNVLDSRNISAVTTSDHRWYVKNEKTGWRETISSKLKGYDKIPLVRRVTNLPGNSMYSNEFLELLGFSIADLTVTPTVQGSFVKERKIKQLDGLLDYFDLAGKWYEMLNGAQHISISQCDVFDAIRDIIGKPKQLTSEFITSLSETQLRALLKGLMADGSEAIGRTSRFYNTNWNVIQNVQLIWTLLGNTSSIGDEPVGWVLYLKTTQFTSVRSSDKGKVGYFGKVWCPQVPNTFWVGIRNNKPFITGNTPGFTPPTPLPLQALPSYVLQELDRIEADMNDISGQHDISKGSAPTGVTAATAISFLQEQDDSKLSHTVSSIEDATEKVARQSLSIVGKYWDTARTVKSVGRNHTFEVEKFKGSDLNGNTDIRVEGGSALPKSLAAKQAFIMDLMKMGFIDPAEGLKKLELGGLESLYDDVETDIRQAQRENIRMEAGQQVAVNTWDEHAIHIVQHNNYRKSQSYDTLDDNTKAIFEAHVQMHTQVMQGKQIQDAQLAMATGQVPGQPPVANSDPTAQDAPQMQQQAQIAPPDPGMG